MIILNFKNLSKFWFYYKIILKQVCNHFNKKMKSIKNFKTLKKILKKIFMAKMKFKNKKNNNMKP